MKKMQKLELRSMGGFKFLFREKSQTGIPLQSGEFMIDIQCPNGVFMDRIIDGVEGRKLLSWLKELYGDE